ncbi:MAG: SCP2 sterol-binding domain-containing protein [Candidatus Thorarchaeota archaeon]
MATIDEVKQVLEGVREKFETPDIKSKFEGFDRTLQFVFTDLETSFHTRIHDGLMDSFSEGDLEKPNLLVTTDSGTLVGIMQGNLSPLDAYSVGKLKAKGSMTDLLKLQILM